MRHGRGNTARSASTEHAVGRIEFLVSGFNCGLDVREAGPLHGRVARVQAINGTHDVHRRLGAVVEAEYPSVFELGRVADPADQVGQGDRTNLEFDADLLQFVAY